MTTALDLIKKYNPCSEAVAWMADQSPENAWNTCTNPDWMLWVATHVGVTDPELRALARAFAMAVIDSWEAPAIVRQWLETGDESIRSAAENAALSAALSAAWSAAENAAWSAAYSAASSAARSAASSAARSAAGGAAGGAQCDQIRALIPWSRLETLLKVEV